MELSLIEKENHILWNEKEQTAIVELYNSRWRNRLLQLCEEEPENYKLVEEDGERLVFEVNKKRLKMPSKKRQMSDEQLERIREMSSSRRKKA